MNVSFDYDGENFTVALPSGSRAVGCQWLPRGPVRFVLVFFHGLGAFVSIKRTFFPPILESGGAIIGTDHCGHGRSPGPRGLNSVDGLMDEIEVLIERANALFPSVPLFLYGHSLGGLASICFAMSGRPSISRLHGLIAEAPWIADSKRVSSSWALKIIGYVGRVVFPDVPIYTGSTIRKTRYPKDFIDKYFNCGLPHDFLTTRLLLDTWKMQRMVADVAKWPSDLPLLFMQGGLDVSVGVEGNMKWLERLRNERPDLVSLVWHEMGEHAMLRNECGPTVLKEIVDFVLRTIEKSC